MGKHLGRLLAIAPVALALSFGGSAAGADTCAAKCEPSCAACCSEWTLSAVCAGGRKAEEGSYASIADAKTAAAAANAAGRAPGTCAGERATWAAHCSADKRVPAAHDTPATTRAIKAEARVHSLLRALDEVERSLHRFGTDRLLTAKAQKDVAAASDGLRSLRQDLVVTKHQAAIATRRDQPEPELAAIEERAAQLDASVTAVSAQVKAVVDDPAAIDAPAEAKAKRIAEQDAAAAAQVAERERQRAEAIRAEQARKEERAQAAADAQQRARNAAEQAKADAAERARKGAEAAEQARAAADAKRLELADRGRQAVALAAAAKLADETRRKEEADRKKQEEEQTKRAAVIASAGETDAKFSKEHDKAIAQLTANIDECAAMIAQMTMLELQPKALPAVKAQAGQSKLALQNHKDKLRVQLAKVRALKERQPRDAALSELRQAQRESDTLSTESAALVAKAKTLH